MSKPVDLEKLRSIGYVGKTRGKARVRTLEAQGRTTGFEVDHADGRVSAVVRPETIRNSVSVSGAETHAESSVRPAPVTATTSIPNPGDPR